MLLKRAFILLSLLFLTTRAEAQILYVVSAGGNSNAAATWSNVSSLGVDASGPPSASDDCIADLNSGQLTINAALSCKTFSATDGVGDYANTITHNAFTWTVAGSITFVTGMNYTLVNSDTSALTISATGTLTTAGKTLGSFTISGGTTTLADNLTTGGPNLVLSGAGVLTPNGKTVTMNRSPTTSANITGAWSFYNLTITNGTSKTDVYILASNITVTNTLTITGNSATNRILFKSTTLGTAKTITVTGATFAVSDTDLRDITFSSTTSVDLTNSGANSVGDCGGNTITGGGSTLTFTTPATQTATGNSANWSTATWTSRVPLPQDDVVLSLTAGQTLTNDMPRMGKSISVTTAMNLTIGIAATNYGSVNWTNINTLTTTGNLFTFEGRGVFTLTSAGKTMAGGITVAMINGTLTMQDAIPAISSSALTISNGSFVTGGFSISVRNMSWNNSNTKSLTLGNSTITITSTGNPTPINASSTGTTFDAGTSTFVLSDTGAASKTLILGTMTYYNLSITGGGAGAVIIQGTNTFNRLLTDGGGTKSITLPGSTTTTLVAGSDLANGRNLITFTSSAGTATISQTSGEVDWAFASLTNIASTGGAHFVARHSTDGTGNTGWQFQVNQPFMGTG